MALAKEMTKCPFCKEPIAAGATRCRHCHADLSETVKKKKSWFSAVNDFRHGFLVGILFTLVLGFLAYLQFFVEK